MPYIPAAGFMKSGAPKPPQKQVISIPQFMGIDLTSKPTLMSIYRSPDCANMMRSAPGKVKRRMGYEAVAGKKFRGRINGVAAAQNADSGIVHAGTNIYIGSNILAGTLAEAESVRDDSVVVSSTGVRDGRSVFLRFGSRGDVVFFDGQAARIKRTTPVNSFGRTADYFSTIAAEAYVPTVMIDRDPVGGGTAYEEINIMSDAFTELFYADGKATAYQMSFDNLLASAKSVVKKLRSDGLTWETLKESTDYTVNYTTGMVTFASAPEATSVDGQSNLSITVSKDRSEKRSWVDKCTVAAAFENDAGSMRLFAAGNPDYPNRDFWSEADDATYWPDLNYSILGSQSESIIGYSFLGNNLATHKSDGSVYVRSPVTDEGLFNRQYFPILSIVRGPRNISPYSFAVVNNEPVFLTENGIYALTSADLTAEKYAQKRSLYLDGALSNEAALADAYSTVWREQYMLAANDNIYILDGTTRTYAEGEPYSNYQYEAFMWKNIPARCVWTWGEDLYFGDSYGQVYRFSENIYTDNGTPFDAGWTTPDLQGALFHKLRRYTAIALRVQPGEETEINVSGDFGEGMTQIHTLRFPASSFVRSAVRRIAAAKANTAAIRVSSAEDAPFEPDAITIEYVQTNQDDIRI